MSIWLTIMKLSRRKSCLCIVSFSLCFFLSPLHAHAQVAVMIGTNFTSSTYDNGTGNGGNSTAIPPDPNGAVGPAHFVEFINGSFTTYDKTNGDSVRISDLSFWSGAGLIISPSSALTDPRIIYDPASQRWFASEVDVDANANDPTLEANNFLLAVSADSDPGGAWQGFLFRADPKTGNFADFPTLGVDANGVYISGDMFHGSNSPVGPSLVSIPKADLLAASPTIAHRTMFGVMDYGVRGQVLQPVTCSDGSSSGNILAVGDIGMDSNPHSNLVSFAVLNATGTNATLTAPVSIAVNPYVVPDDPDLGFPMFTPMQPDGTTMLDGNDARFSAKVYAVAGIIYAVHNTEINNRIAIRWYRIDAANRTLIESGDIINADLDLFFPSIAVNPNGTIVIACNGSSIDTPVSCYAIVGQTLNGVTTFASPLLLQSGATSYHGDDELVEQLFEVPASSRWGDYSAISVDPSDPGRFWTIGMYPSDAANPDVWSTQITELITTTAPPLLSISPSGTNVMVSWSSSATGYQLQSAASLAPPVNWSNVSLATNTNAGQAFVLAPVSGGSQFFRLSHP
jgi:hypothetical protein